jgi:hypothetical protein
MIGLGAAHRGVPPHSASPNFGVNFRYAGAVLGSMAPRSIKKARTEQPLVVYLSSLHHHVR